MDDIQLDLLCLYFLVIVIGSLSYVLFVIKEELKAFVIGHKKKHTSPQNHKAMKPENEDEIYEAVKEIAQALPLREAARIFLVCLFRETKPTEKATSVTLEMTHFDIEVKLKFQTEGK